MQRESRDLLSRRGPMSAGHGAGDKSETKGLPTTIGPAATITGDVFTSGAVQVDGAVEGDIRCRQLVITETGAVRGNVTAAEIWIRGRFRGQIWADRLEVCTGCHVEGDIVPRILAIEQGAHFEGNCSMALAEIHELSPQEKGKAPKVDVVAAS